MSFGKLIALIMLTFVGGFIALKIIGGLLGWALHMVLNIAIPLALVVGVVYLIYRATEKKSITGDRKILP